MNNAIGYRRLSDRDQSRYSLEYQENAIKDYCKRNFLNLVAIYTDNGESSYTFDRPDYRQLETFIGKHKRHAQYLIIMDHDRFSRNLSEALSKITELEEKYHIKVLASNEPIDIDPSDPYVFMQRAMSYMVANSELLRIRKRTHDGMRQAQLSGRYLGKAPFGYLNSTDPNNKSLIKVNDNNAFIIKKIFEDYLIDIPIFEIHRQVKKLGFKPNGNSAIPRVLSNPVYAGLVRVSEDKKNSEKIIKGLHQPIVSEADYWLTQEKLGRKRPTKAQPKDEFPLRGLLKCWCGKSMTAGFSKGKNKYYLYYRCTEHNNVNISGQVLHQKFGEILNDLSFTPKQIDYIAKQSKASITNSLKENQNIVKSRQKQLEEVNAKIDKLETRLMNDEIDGATFKKWKERFNQERVLLLQELKENNNDQLEVKLDKLKAILPKLSQLNSLYQILPPHHKQTLGKAVFKHSLTYSEGAFRTPSIDPSLEYNSLKSKEKGLLFVEQPSDVWEKLPCGSRKGN